ncbi:hypothetical protein ORI20_20560 [Mycobacterium sp. CVI_P3]|uniref:Uncharacterized protein n=1 Tax=Mycobacterium pinniadriaticum TaxID=2994102 RepID=A0ABT3SHU0_9MYCO|nr:hypothetical protein [Mycobacterium pinniadriaticum]MCX2932668.1 hypothetical protein [Mycobacterium pinniadriaticum]MCX2939092.1 hypothetical protein [Mycobacterium pinniadriaticum]
MSVKSLVAAPPSGRRRPLLIDDVDYSTAVIRQGAPVPWTDTTLATGHFGQVRGLLDPDALWIDVQRLQAAHCAARPELVEAMRARTRTGYPLRTMLGDEATLTATLELLTTLGNTARRELVLHVPSPACWLAWAHEVPGNPLDGVDADRADSASMYIAEWLGRLGTLPVALVLLDGRGALGPEPEQLDSYTAIANVVGHFDWSLALWGRSGIDTAPGGPRIGVVPDEYWTVGADVPDAEVLATTIPSSASPERVLDQLAGLR